MGLLFWIVTHVEVLYGTPRIRLLVSSSLYARRSALVLCFRVFALAHLSYPSHITSH